MGSSHPVIGPDGERRIVGGDTPVKKPHPKDIVKHIDSIDSKLTSLDLQIKSLTRENTEGKKTIRDLTEKVEYNRRFSERAIGFGACVVFLTGVAGLISWFVKFTQ